ncbi:MAG: serine--tRNA ligase [Chlamydiae bacterium]|nr:serine--tRNA ligase [Chlamydiota bacterium]MBI3276283.1 serine--tRNA ligase [Chlamydiota bacterium]
MLDLKWIRENREDAEKGVQAKGVKLDINELLQLDEERKSLSKELDRLRQQMNQSAKEIGLLKSKGMPSQEKMDSQKSLSQKISYLDSKVDVYQNKIAEKSLYIPNIPHKTVPVGISEEQNVEVKSWGEKPKMDFTLLPHWEIGEKLGIIDMKRASKITGTGFVVYRGLGAKLERALINFMLDLHINEHGYQEVSPPFVVNRRSMTGTGQLPKLEKDMYRIDEDDLFLIPTAEVPVTNLYMDEILEEKDLPMGLVAYTPCFRREAGSYGKDTRGIIRVHQFDKVEMVRFAPPEKSYDELEKLVVHAEDILQRLGLPYRIRLLCSGDMSFAAAKCYDIEVWAAAQGRYLEVSSCSNFEAFQARRANIKFRRETGNGKPEYVHTLNGSGIALARTVVALLENYQQKDGSVKVPSVLIPYLSGVEEIREK